MAMTQQRRPNRGNGREEAITKFVLGSKELEGKTAEFQYDKGWYTISDLVGEERTQVYRSRNAAEAYTKWNVYIGRKKERPSRPREDKNEEGSSPNQGDAPSKASASGRRDGGRKYEKKESAEGGAQERRPDNFRNRDKKRSDRSERPSGDQKPSDRRNQERRPRRSCDRKKPADGGAASDSERKEG